MAAADYASVVQQLYVSYFGRPADFYGLTSFENQLAALKAPTSFIALNAAAQSGTNPGLTALINTFSGSAESTALYGSGNDTISISKFVNAVYNNVLNRDADTAGLSYWVNAITTGALSKANAAAAITEGALSNSTAQGLVDAKTVTAKVAVAADFTASLTTAPAINGFSGATAAAAARALLQSVTSTTDVTAFHTTVLSSVAAIAGGAIPTTSTTLTVSQDSLTGTAGNDIFNAGAAQDGAGHLINTLQNVDVINGGAGTDTLNVTEAQGATVAASLTSVEVINARFAAAGKIDLTNATGVTNANITGSTVAGTVMGVGAVANLGVSSQIVDATFTGNTAKTINLNLDTVGKSNALNNVTLDDGATTLSVTANKANVTVKTLVSETALTVAATGANKLAFNAGVANLKTVTVTGDGSLNLATTLSNATKVDASANNGGLTATVANTVLTLNGGAGNDAITYTGAMAAQTKVALGAGDDTLTLAGAADSTAVVDGGAGNDTLVVTTATFLDGNSKATYTGFEVLEVSANGAGQSFDPTLLNGITSYVVDLSANVVELKNLAAAPAVTVDGNVAGLTLTLKTATGSTDSATVTLNNGLTATTAAANSDGVKITDLKAVDVETVTLHSNGTIGATPLDHANLVNNDVLNTSLSKVVIDGATNIKFVTGAITHALTVDATAATGVVTVDGTGAGKTLNINGGAGSDVLKAGATGGMIYGGAAGDAITLGAGNDVVVYKSAAESTFALKADGTLDTAKIDVVGNTDIGDKVDLTSLGFTANTDKVVVQKAAANLATLATLAASADFYNDASSIARGVVAVAVGGDTFVFADANHDHKFDAATDLVVKITGAGLVTTDVIFG